MPLRPESKAVLAEVEDWPQGADLSAEEQRDLERRRHRTFDPPDPPAMAVVEDYVVETPANRVDVRVYRPHPETCQGTLVYVHGGGWVVGDLVTSAAQCRMWAAATNCVVVAPDYRLAPEHPFPAGLDDVIATVEWVAGNRRTIGAGPPIIVGGDSAGGNLSAAAAIALRDRGGPPLALQLLLYPALRRDPVEDSRARLASGYWLTEEAVQSYWDRYLGPAAESENPLAEPLCAEDLRGLPEAVVVTAEFDVLRDEGERYAERLREAGVTTRLLRADGMLHGFFAIAGWSDEARRTIAELGTFVQERLASGMGAPDDGGA